MAKPVQLGQVWQGGPVGRGGTWPEKAIGMSYC